MGGEAGPPWEEEASVDMRNRSEGERGLLQVKKITKSWLGEAGWNGGISKRPKALPLMSGPWELEIGVNRCCLEKPRPQFCFCLFVF